MATVNFTSGSLRGSYHRQHFGLEGEVGFAENFLDFAANPVLAADVIQALSIPKGALVTKVICHVATAEGATCTATVGDGDSAAAWDASVNLNSATTQASLEATDTYGAGKVYTSADTIDLVMGHDTDAAKVLVLAQYVVTEKYGA